MPRPWWPIGAESGETAADGAALVFPVPRAYNPETFGGGSDVHFCRQIRFRIAAGGALSERTNGPRPGRPDVLLEPELDRVWRYGRRHQDPNASGTFEGPGFSRTRFNFPNGMFVGNTSSSISSAFSGINQAGMFGSYGSLSYQSTQFGHKFGGAGSMPVTLFGGLDTVK